MEKESKGFIKLERSIFEHWIFQDAEKFKAFVDLIQLARWKDEKLLIGNNLITIPRGSYYTSELKLAERWGWGIKKTRSFLKLLENEKMITKKGTPKGTTLTVTNYDFYQSEGTTKGITKDTTEDITEEQQRAQQRHNKGHTKEEIKERKEIKEGKEVKEYIDKPSKHKHGEYKHVLLTDDEYTKLVNELGIPLAKDTITFLDEYIEMKGYKAKSHYLCIKKWVVDAVKEKQLKANRNKSGSTQNLKQLFKEAQNEENGINSDFNDPF